MTVKHFEKEATATIQVTLNYTREDMDYLPDNEYMERRLRNITRRIVHEVQREYYFVNVGWDEQIVIEDRGGYIE